MPMSRTLRLSSTALLALAAGCSDSSGPSGGVVDPEQIVSRCSRGTITNASATRTYDGTVNAQDCQVRGDVGRFEGYRLPKTAFGEQESLLLDLEADFDGAIAIAGADGDLVWIEDDDIGDDLGREQFVIPLHMIPDQDEYFIAVYAFQGEEGAYTFRVGPVPPPA